MTDINSNKISDTYFAVKVGILEFSESKTLIKQSEYDLGVG